MPQVAINVPRFGGPTLVGEWTIADTDCALYLNAVGEGYGPLYFGLTCAFRSRWEGTYSGTEGTAATGPGCAGGNCTCAPANANSEDYSAVYKEFLSDFYIAQVQSFDGGKNLIKLVEQLRRLLGLVLLVQSFSSIQLISRTWDTENATQCRVHRPASDSFLGSYRKLLDGGIVDLQQSPDSRFNCSGATPNYTSLGLSESF
jgi:hypothetical protein